MADSCVLYKTGTNTPYDFKTSSNAFEVANTGTTHVEVAFVNADGVAFSPSRVNVAPGERATVNLTVTKPATTKYYTSFYATPNIRPSDSRYRAGERGKTIGVVPVGASAFASVRTQTLGLITSNRVGITETGWSGRYIYRAAERYLNRVWSFDALLTMEPNLADIPASDLKTNVDYHLAKQLTSPYSGTNVLGAAPVGTIATDIWASAYASEHPSTTWHPLHASGIPAGTVDIDLLWGQNPMPSYCLDHCLNIAQSAWHYGVTQNFDSAWQTWFASVKDKLALAYTAGAGNVHANGLVAQSSTAPGVCWSFQDIIRVYGGHVGLTLLAMNVSRCMADMCEAAGMTADVATWDARANALQAAVRAAFKTNAHGGHLPWTRGGNMDNQASVDLSAFAVWSGALTDEQAGLVSDWLAYNYATDKAAGTAGNIFTFKAGCRGYVRQNAKDTDAVPGVKTSPDWWFLAFPMGTSANGGYWCYQAPWVAAALWVKHPDTAVDFATGAVTDYIADSQAAYECVNANGTKLGPIYAQAGSAILGAVAPGTATSISVDVAEAEWSLLYATQPPAETAEWSLVYASEPDATAEWTLVYAMAPPPKKTPRRFLTVADGKPLVCEVPDGSPIYASVPDDSTGLYLSLED